MMDERATFVCGTQVDPRMLLDSASFISKFYIKIAWTICSAGVHDEEEEEEINNDVAVAALGDSWSSWRPPRAPKAVGALPMLFIALLVAPPISSTGHCSCASQATCHHLPQSSLISRPTSMLPGKTLPLSKCCQHQSISPLPP